MVRANAVKLFLNLITATMSVAIFIYGGKILYIPGLALGVGMSIGAVMGAGFFSEGEQRFPQEVCVCGYYNFRYITAGL